MSSPTHTFDDVWPHPSRIPAKVRAVLSGIPGMVGYWDRQLRNCLANDEYVEFFGWAPEELFGTHMRDVFPAELYEANLPFVRRALQGRDQLFEGAVTDVYGETRHLQVSYIPDVVDGEVQGVFALGTDISHRVETEQALQRSADQYRALARNMPSGFVLLFDEDLRFLIADGVELRAFGFAREDLEGLTLHEAFPSELAEELEPRYRAALSGKAVTWERVLGRRTFKLSAGPVVPESGPVVSGLVTALDITAERTTERTWAALHEVAADVARQLPPEEVARDIARALVDIFGVTASAVGRYGGQGVFDILAMAPRHLATLDHQLTFAPEDASAIARVQQTGEPAMVRYPPESGTIARQLTEAGIRVGAAAPIHVEGQLWGAVAMASDEEDGLDEVMVDRMAGFASLLELAVGNTSAWDTLAAEAGTDELTGLPNRRTFAEHLATELERARRHHRDVAVAVMDLDHFKQVNDQHGHPVGDRVLMEFAARARASSRDGELVARMGGEEFAWIMPDTDAATGLVAAERLRAAISDAPFAEVGNLTVSVGVSALSDLHDGGDPVACADQALYVAKRAGRDRVSRYAAPTA